MYTERYDGMEETVDVDVYESLYRRAVAWLYRRETVYANSVDHKSVHHPSMHERVCMHKENAFRKQANPDM